MSTGNSYQQSIEQAKAGIASLSAELVILDKKIAETGTKALEMSKAFNAKTPGDLTKQIDAQIAAIKKLEAATDSAQKKREAQVKAESNLRERLARQREKEESDNFKNAQRATQAATKLATEKKKIADAEAKAQGPYAKTLAQMNAQKIVLRDLIILEGKRNATTKQAQKEYDVLAAKIRAANQATAQGNTLMQTAVARLKSLAVAFGFFGTIYLIANGIKDSIKRIRDFDKEMQNMAGVTRSTRADLSDLESMIKAVAGTSVMTSNQVAKLATSLLVLGKSKADVMLLLKPANDLGIALNTTSEAAGEFLVQSLNSFGASSESAAEYADVLATVRTSTSLDFQKMVDSFQYLSPISKVLGEDLAYTGAVIGILADNGLKAQNAGRLLGTAQQKLAKQGISLAEALEMVNEAQREGKSNLEVLATASTLFGAQAGKVGVILAANSDIIQRNAQAIRDNGGALDDLIGGQMESFDAKMKILDSTWEEWLLSLQAGEGIMGKMFLGGVNQMTKFFKVLTDVNKELREFQAIGKASGNIEMSKYLTAQMKELGLTMKEVADIELKNVAADLEIINKKLYDLQQGKQDLIDGGLFGEATTEANIKKWTEAQAAAKEMMNVIREARGEIKLFDTDAADAFDDKNVDHLLGALVPLRDRLKEVEQEQQNLLDLPAPNFSTQFTVDELEKERVKLAEVIKQYEQYIASKQPYFDFANSYSSEDNEVIKDRAYWVGELKRVTELFHGEITDEGRKVHDLEMTRIEKEIAAWDRKEKKKKDKKDHTADDAYKLLETRMQIELDLLKEIKDNEDKSLTERLDANQLFQEKTIQLIGSKADYEVAKAAGRKDLILAIRKQQEADERKAMEKSLDDIEKIRSKDFDNRIARFEKVQAADKLAMEQEIENIRDIGVRRGQSTEYVEERVQQVKEVYLKKDLERQLDYALKELEIMAITEDEKIKSAQKIHDLRAKLNDLALGIRKDDEDKAKKDHEDELKRLEEKKQKQIEYMNAVADIALQIGALFKTFSDRRIAKIDDEISAMNDMYANQLDNENLTAERRKEIEDEQKRRNDELEKKKREEKVKAAQAEKKFALFEIGMATAIAVMQAAPNVPLQIMVAALGALQAATVLATPIPKYAKGRKGGKEEMAILGDGGKHEPILDKHGNLRGISPNTPTLMKLNEGDHVLPSTSHLSKDYQSILNASVMTTLAGATVNNDSDKLAKIFDAKLSTLQNKIENGIEKGFGKVPRQGNRDLDALANRLKFNMKRDAL